MPAINDSAMFISISPRDLAGVSGGANGADVSLPKEYLAGKAKEFDGLTRKAGCLAVGVLGGEEVARRIYKDSVTGDDMMAFSEAIGGTCAKIGKMPADLVGKRPF